MVITALREVEPMLAVTVTVTVPLLVPELGDTVAQVWSLLACQEPEPVTVIA